MLSGRPWAAQKARAASTGWSPSRSSTRALRPPPMSTVVTSRVGRGSDKSYCLLIPETENAVENERLAAMAETNDGFILAERDLQQRGPGDFLGTRQSGFAELKMANLMDVRLIEKARNEAKKIFDIDPEFNDPAHELLKTTFNYFWTETKGELS